ncbi:unnamed protein product [Aphanomyces euteiches]
MEWKVTFDAVTVLSTSVNLLQTGFDSVKTDTWGLTCFAGPGVKGDRPSGWEKLWPTLFTAQLILILQAVIQLVIYMRSDAGRAEREAMLAQAPGRPVFFISRITLEIDMVFRFVGGIVTYVGFLLLGFIYEVDSSGRVTLFGLLQVFLMFTLLGSHMASMIKSPRGNSTKTQFLWRVVLVYEVLVLVVRYIYQFEAVATYIHEKWHLDKFMTLEDVVTRASQFWDPEKDAKPNSKKQRPRKPSEWHASSSNMSEDTPFLKSVQDFLIRFASEGSVTLTMLMLLVSAFIHLNVISVMYLLVVRWIMVSHPITVCRNWNYLVIMLLFVCVTQYFIMLWFPPFLDWPRNTTVPWKWLEHHDEYAEYLALNFQHPMGLFSDYCCILFVFMIPGAKPYYLEIEKRTMAAELAAHETDSGQNHRDTLTASVVPGDANDFTTNAKENQQPWRLLVFMVMNYWVFVLLIMVFVSGCIRSGVASGIYLAFAIYMLVNVNDVDSPESKMLSRLREFSWGYMFLLVLFQTPVFGNPTEYCTLGTHVNGKVCLSAPAVLDLNKFPKNYPSAPDVGATVPVLSIVIFWMINIQELIYQSPLYDYVRAFTSRESDQSQRRCRALHEEVLMDRLERWQALKHEKQAAILRLKSIISRMVNKVEEMMDIASGLNYSLPPSAPQPPTIVTEETTQNSVTLVWNAPESPLHRIRSYTITRQLRQEWEKALSVLQVFQFKLSL